MALFDYKDYDSTYSAELVDLSKDLSLNSISELDNWQRTTPSQLGLSDDVLDDTGYYTIESPASGDAEGGPQLKILEHYDENGDIDKLAIVFAVSNSTVDILDYFQLNANTISENMNPLLETLKEYAEANGLTGEDVIVTGYSLGGGYTNIMAKNVDDLADGFYSNSDFIAHESPYIYDNSDVIFNMGYENDAVYRIIGGDDNLADAIDNMDLGFSNSDQEFSSSADNIVLFDDTYSSILSYTAPSILNVAGWAAHASGKSVDLIEQISNSNYYEFTEQDSVVVVDKLSSLTRWMTWVGDKSTATSDHQDLPAFVFGTQYDDRLFGNDAGDYIDAGDGDDKIKTGNGADRVDGGEGSDTVWVEGKIDDWNVYQTDDSYFISNSDGSNLKQLENVEAVKFTDTSIFKQSTYDLDDLDISNSVNGSDTNDVLAGDIIFAGKGDDILTATSENSLLHGGEGSDQLFGLSNDALYGAEGNDILVAGSGENLLSGGVGNDVFILDNEDSSNTIIDFNSYSGDLDSILISSDIIDSEATLLTNSEQSDSDTVISYGEFSVTVQNSQLDEVLDQVELV